MNPLVIAHRGASGCRPEHTLESYALAIEQGADFIEPDLVSTRDGVLVARHENALALLDADGSLLEATTDVAERAEFASRCCKKSIDGHARIGWFTEDFTLAELRTLRARERLPALRGTAFDDRFTVPTFDEILALLDEANARRPGRPVGVYPEIKHPSHFRKLGLPLEPPLVQALHRHGGQGPRPPVFIQSFEVGNLRLLRELTELPLVQLVEDEGQPWDFSAAGDPRRYADLLTPASLKALAGHVQALGVHADLVIPRRPDGRLGAPTPLVAQAHEAGLAVHAWTFRAENRFLPADFRRGTDPAAHGDLAGCLEVFLDAGLDGLFTDHPAQGRRAVAARAARRG
ncbi:glycerophosphodiester phosphodiesterase [Azohydromonas australica]|uniref:glycerophosphodiester phosphodiesterase n=1 Tax=Azohydromonas australica TaxID=364039 RepID=UPI00040E769B|nr:glycerophosphodiester phosphodiesterase [Azohydromonas australica]